MNGTGIFLCNFSGMIKNVLPSLQRSCPPTPSLKPRTCGEKQAAGAEGGQGRGSPPRMRGKGGLAGGRTVEHGITPAYAGKRWYTRCAKKLPPDHPRMCGEKGSFIILSEGMIGSPPRMRGKDCNGKGTGAAPGITPACAGKSRSQ